MALRRLTVDGALAEWLDGLVRPSGVLAELYASMADDPAANMMTHPDLGALLRVLVTASGGRRVLEVGTFVGTSALWMADGLGPDGHIDTLELDAERAAIARSWFAKAGLDDRIAVHAGPAAATLPGLEPGYDLCYVDADKVGYPAYLEAAILLVRPGGLVVADNLFLGGAVAAADPGESARAMREFAAIVTDHPRLRSTVLTVGDGISLSVVLGP
jgi:caffeoyl-CoA O-methyltransferase